jgi:hypothetical protein
VVSTLATFESSGFILVGTPKSLVYAAYVDKEVLHRRIMDACQTIRNYRGTFQLMWRSMMRHVGACIESHGGHLQHLL